MAKKNNNDNYTDSRKPANRIRKPLTQEQRARKNLRDRKRRMDMKRAGIRHSGICASSGCSGRCKSPVSGVSCAGCPSGVSSRAGIRRSDVPDFVESVVSMLQVLGLIRDDSEVMEISGSVEEVSPGVVRHVISLPGTEVDITVSCSDELVGTTDLRSALAGIRKDVSDIVDRQRDIDDVH